MNWLSRLLDSISPPLTGLELDEPDPVALAVPPAPGRFIRALDRLAGPNAVLYWEGPADRVLAAWLRRQTQEPVARISIGISPVHDFYHVALADGVLDELAARIERTKPAPSRVHLHVHEDGRVILQWRRAFLAGPVLISRSVRPERIDAFIREVGHGIE